MRGCGKGILKGEADGLALQKTGCCGFMIWIVAASFLPSDDIPYFATPKKSKLYLNPCCFNKLSAQTASTSDKRGAGEVL
jgi:hypothetical protein